MATSTKRIRGAELQATRLRIIKRDAGLCGMCLLSGYTTHGEEVDHKLPLEQGGAETDDNRWLLCKPCHRTKTATDRGHRAIGYDTQGRPTDTRHPWNRSALPQHVRALRCRSELEKNWAPSVKPKR